MILVWSCMLSSMVLVFDSFWVPSVTIVYCLVDVSAVTNTTIMYIIKDGITIVLPPPNCSKLLHWEEFLSFLFDLQIDQRRLDPLVQGNSLIHVGLHNFQLHWYWQFAFDNCYYLWSVGLYCHWVYK